MKECKVSLWRGYCFEDKSEDNIEFIKKDLLLNGDSKQEASWLEVQNIVHHCDDVKYIIRNILEEEENVSRYSDRKAKFVCGDTIGADFYATRQGNIGIVAEVKVDINRLVIDGRDFLYYVIPRIIDTGTRYEIKELLIKAFGEKTNDYLNYGIKLKGLSPIKLFKFVDYFCMDSDIIKSHLESKILIKGRYKTQFKSAFGVIDGIKPNEVVNIMNPGSKINAEYDDVLCINSI